MVNAFSPRIALPRRDFPNFVVLRVERQMSNYFNHKTRSLEWNSIIGTASPCLARAGLVLFEMGLVGVAPTVKYLFHLAGKLLRKRLRKR